ncbi:MAG: DUF1989 domain-containing protein, partial [Clostridia bacterium]|nr:DUF1989 domain-containing protein [Clostridia bacterium]
HWWGGGFCSEGSNRVRFGIPGTPNCRDNLVAAMADYGFTAKDIELDSCVSFFMHKTFEPDGTQLTVKPGTKPGDHVDVKALRDLLVAVSNCPQVRNACNDFNLTPLKVVIFEEFSS